MPLIPKQQPPYYERGPLTGPTKQYIALLTQTTTNPPVATVLYNSFQDTIVWTRPTGGFYHGTLTGAFPSNKTSIKVSNTNAGLVGATRITDDTIEIKTINASFNLSDAILNQSAIIIEIYP